MKKIFLLACSLSFSFTFAQYVNIKQTSSLSGGGNNIMSSFGCEFSPSQNFIFGYRSMMGENNLLKLNSLGDTVFARMINTGNLGQITETSDGSIYGFYMPNSDSIITTKVSSAGSRLWTRKTLTSSGGNWNGLCATAKNTHIVYTIGSNYWTNGGHLWLGELDSSGTQVMNHSVDMSSLYGTNVYNVTPTAIKITPAGNIVVLGNTYVNTGTPQFIFVMEFSSAGVLLWTKTYQVGVGGGSSTAFYPIGLNITSSNEILISGTGTGYTGTVYMRLDQNGNYLWGKSIADGSTGCQLLELSNGELALHIARSNQTIDAIAKSMVSILDPAGNIRVTRSFGSANVLTLGTIGQNASGQVMALATNDGGAQEIFIFSMDTLGHSSGCYDVIPSLPVTTFTANFVGRSFVSQAETSSGMFSVSGTAYGSATFIKTSPDITVNGVVTNPLCHGTFGNVNINPTGGATPYSYKWSNGTSSQNLLNVPGGIYTIRISDNNACVKLDTFTVVEPAVLAASYTVGNVTCYGTHNGSINVTTSGGTMPYGFQWTTQDTTQNLSNLSGGFYQLTITDAHGCTKTLAVLVSEPQQLIAGIMSSQNVKCHGACDGSLTGVASGGTAPYTYLWNDPGSATTTTVGGLCPGNYLFSVTDAHNCYTFANAVITEPAALSIATNASGSLCGGSTGMASAAVAGGVSPYTYSWSNSTTNDTAFSLMAGTYTVTSHDANNCAVSSVVTVGITTPTPDICMVTVDSLSTHNILLWDKTPFSNIAYFNIYREDITNNYTLIAAVNYDSLSEYHDYDTTMADPNVTTKRYKISAVDTCGNESAKSNFHNTIFIQHNNGTFTWNTYTIQNSPNPVTSYRLMRDDYATGNWQQIGTTAGTQNVLNDPNYSSFATTADWRVETVWGISCTATLRQSNGGVQSAIVKSKSNISNNRAIGVKENGSGMFAMYPNPAMDVVTIAFEKAGSAKIELVNTLGETVRTIQTVMQQATINTNDLASGVYYVKVSSEGKQGISRLVVQK